MRFLTLAASAFVGLFVAFTPAPALPVPKLPPEATDKPSIVVRVRPVGELIKDISYVAKMVGQEEVFEAVKPGIEPVIDVLDAQKPLGFYARISPKEVDSFGVLLLPVKNQKDFINTLKLFGVAAVEGEGGLYTVNPPGSPFPVLFRFANGYCYATVRNSPDAEAGLAPTKLFAPQALFKQGDDSLLSVVFNIDALPNELKTKALEGLEEGVRMGKIEIAREHDDPTVRGFLETALEELAIKAQSVVVHSQSLAIRVNFDRAKEDMGASATLTPRPGSDLAADMANIGLAKSLGAGLVSADSAIHLAVNMAVPNSLKKALDPVIDRVVAEGWKKAEHQEVAKQLVKALEPTMRAGVLDGGVNFRGPGADDYLTMVGIVAIKDADKLDELGRKLHPFLPEVKRKDVRIDVEKVGDIGLHEVDPDLDREGRDMFGPNAKGIFAFRKDALVFAIGPRGDAIAGVKSALSAAPKSAPVVDGMVSVRRLAPIIERKDPGAVAAAKKAFPAGIDDAIRLAVTGGDNVELRLSLSTRFIQFGQLIGEARRNR